MIKTVTLKSGDVVAEMFVTLAKMQLTRLFQEAPQLFAEFVALCRDPGHELWPISVDALKEIGLLEGRGKVHSVTRRIVCCAVTGEAPNFVIKSPVMGEDER